MAEGKLYFAYGSNINLDQMAQRCPDAQVVGPVTLENYELLFRGNLRGAGGSPSLPGRGAQYTACCGTSRQSVSAPWIIMRVTLTCMGRSR